MPFQLLVVRGRSASTALKLISGLTTVGRTDECQIRIRSSQVSRRHCELFEKQGSLVVKDLGSSNGTFVNGKKVRGEKVLEPGDELTVGQVTLKVARVGEAPPPPRTPAKSTDTAVAEAISVDDDAAADEFEIDFDFDDLPVAEEASAGAGAGGGAAAAKPKAKAPATETVKTPEPEIEVADEAIADFLLDIKLDDEE
jgi:pSer/pThr/pTyr-binding forkhead associated (FHA) protein